MKRVIFSNLLLLLITAALVAICVSSSAMADTMGPYPGMDPQDRGIGFYDDVPAGAEAYQVILRPGDLVGAIEMVVKTTTGSIVPLGQHGTASNPAQTLTLGAGEYITQVYGRYGDAIDSITFRTSSGRTARFGGSGGQYAYDYTAPPNMQIVGFLGASGVPGWQHPYVYAIGVILTPRQLPECTVDADCDDRNPCTTDACDPATGACVNTAVDCDDRNPCTTDACDPATGACVNTAVDCDDQNPCTTDACDRATGACVNTAVDCDDQNPCTDGCLRSSNRRMRQHGGRLR